MTKPSPPAARKPTRTPRGFAAMDPDKQRDIAAQGGRAAHGPDGHGHEFTGDEARNAGRIGGRAVSRDRAHMAEIGRKGALARVANARKSAATAEASRAETDPGLGTCPTPGSDAPPAPGRRAARSPQ